MGEAILMNAYSSHWTNVLESHLHQNKVYNYVDLVKEDVYSDSDRSTRWKLSSPYTVEEKFAEEDR